MSEDDKTDVEPKEFIVTMRVTLTGCVAYVLAHDEAEARAKASSFDLSSDGVETDVGSLLDWTVESVEENK